MASVRMTPFSPKPWALVAYFVVFVLTGLVGHSYVSGGTHLDAAVPWLRPHASNLLLSFWLVLGYGFLRMLYGARLPELLLATGVVVACNVVYEGLLTFANTRDMTDALAGALGAGLALGIVAVLRRWGLRRNPPPA